MRNNHRTCSFVLAVALANVAGAAAVSQDTSAHTIAAAKMLETKGDVAGAVRVLQQALAGATTAAKPALSEQLSRLVAAPAVAKTESAAATPQGATQDPVDRLIRVLNTGDQTPEVRSAIQQLHMLGNLVVPHLIRAFPELGPFGVMNALTVMRGTSDPRIGKFLAGQVKTAAPEVVTAIVWRLDDLSEKVALAVADEMLKNNPTEQHLLAILRVYLKHQPAAATCMMLRKKLFESDTAKTRHYAATYAISANEMTEAEALRIAKTLTPEQVTEMVAVVEDSTWVKLGLLGFPPPGSRQRISDHVKKFEWWRAPAEAAPLLLEVRGADHEVKERLREMVRLGWRVSAALDQAFWKFAQSTGQDGWRIYLQALPDDGEDRAIRAWEQNKRSRAMIIEGLSHTEHDWTRLVVMDLLAADNPSAYSKYSFNFDWRKATPESIEGLVKFARKWPEVTPKESHFWADGLVQAYSSWPVLPVDVVQPLFASGFEPAWKAVRNRNPELLLTMARDLEVLPTSMISWVVDGLRRYGTEADVPTAIQIMRSQTPKGHYNMAAAFLGRVAKGNPEVLALVVQPSALEPAADNYSEAMAVSVARGVNVDDLPSILALLPKLRHNVVLTVCFALRGQVGEAHVEALAAALKACYGETWRDTHGRGGESEVGNRTLAIALMQLLGQTKSEAALPHLRRVYEGDKMSWLMVRIASGAALNAAGSSRRALLQQMLKSTQQEVVVAAVQVEDLRSDAELRELAFEGVLRFAKEENESHGMFDVIEKDAQLALALKLLNHKELTSFDGGLVDRALLLLDGRKDAHYLPQLSRAAKHRSEYTRAKTAKMLGNTFVVESVEPLLDMLKDDSKTVRAAAQTSLDQIANYLDERAKWEKRFGKGGK